MAHRTAVIDIVGLSSSLLGEATPNINAFAARDRGRIQRLKPVLPAVTCSVQSSMLTGAPVREHGIVGNGWYNHELAEIQFWKQSNRLVQGEKVWETARKRDREITCANMFWWFNMYSSVDCSLTPRPQYKADGRKIPDCYSQPAQLRDELQAELGQFPLFNFWGPASSIASSEWIAEASMRVHEKCDPTLMLIYLPHLDYGLQKLGPGHPAMPDEVRAIDGLVGRLIDFFDEKGVRIVLLSEYGIEPVTDAVFVNRVLREAGALQVSKEGGHEILDAGASSIFAVADHQVAHVYLRRPDDLEECRELLESTGGIEQVLDREAQARLEIDHPRAGDLVLVAAPDRWFAYDYWLDPGRAPDFARTVDIHRKPGYDPRELFIDPQISFPKIRIAWKLLMKKLGFRTLLDFIPLDATLVKGSHGRIDQPPEVMPVLITNRADDSQPDELPCTAVRDVILGHLFEDG